MTTRNFASSNRVALRYVKETERGVTPATPALTPIRYTGESLNFKINTETSDEIRADRMVSDVIQTDAMSEGDINAEFSFASFDDFFQGAFKASAVFPGTPGTDTGTDVSITDEGSGLWALNSALDIDFSAITGLVVGSMIKCAGFTTAGTFYARVASITASKIEIYPTSVIAAESAGDSVTVTALEHLRNGTTQVSFTLQKAFLDLSTPKFYNLKGCCVGKMEWDITSKAKLGLTFSFMGGEGDQTTTQFSGATVGTANSNPVMSASRNVAIISLDDNVATPYYFTKAKLSMDNADRARDAIGSFYPIDIVPGRVVPKLDIEIYLEDKVLFDKFKNNTAFPITIPVFDSNGKGYILHMPRCKFDSIEESAAGLDQDVFVSGSITALADTTGTYEIQLSKVA